MSSVTCRDVVKRFGDVVAVNRVNLDVREGEFVVLVGPSGCGKTTTLRMIAGLETISDGEILLDDQAVTRMPPRQRDMAMVFQNYALYPHMRVFDNIAYSLRLRRVPKEEIRRRVTETARLLNIEPLLERWPRQLSGGQRQRVALGRAIVRQPKAFLMDEPLSNLDAQLRVYMRREIIHLQRQLGVTTIYVTHDQVEAMTMGHRIVVMKDGVVQQVGEPDTVYRRPRNIFVARFIGSPAMNLQDGTLVTEGGQLVIRAPGVDLPIPEGVRRSLLASDGGGRRVAWGIRPEDVTVGDDGDGEAPAVRGAVDLIEHLGADAYASITVGDDLLLARVSPDHALRVNQRVALRFNLAKMHLFDAESGESLLSDQPTVPGEPAVPLAGGVVS